MDADIVIHNGTVVTVNPDFDIFENGMVCIRNGCLRAVEAQPDNAPLPAARETIDACGGIVMPGLVNSHTHLPMTLFRGLADDLPLAEWLNGHIFPAEQAHIHPESVYWASLLACAELVLSGTTTCCDGYFLEEHVARAVRDFGLRAVLGQGVIDFPVPGVVDPKENIRQAAAFVERWQGLCDRIIPSVFCHSPYTCSSETLSTAKKLARQYELLYQIHVAETRRECDEIRAAHQVTPVQYLDRLNILDDRTLLVHGVWLEPADIDLIAARGVAVSHNPESNMKLGCGTAPVPQLMAAGITVALGTDGCASNNNLDLIQEMDTTAKLHKAVSADPLVMDAATVLKMATVDGARAVGLGRQIGSLEVGKQADLIILNTGCPHMVPMYHPVSHLVYSAKGSDVRDVIVGGKILVRNGRLTSMNLDEIMARVRRLAEAVAG
jgi:5-methylthioadenosine/S-adenosylhomocysteine deaminase